MNSVNPMSMGIQSFRQALLTTLGPLRAARPNASLHLVYVPELADPLSLGGDVARQSSPIRAPLRHRPFAPKDHKLPRVISLDCRRVAAFLLETSADIDDPLFESSIVQAHAEQVHQDVPHHVPANDEAHFVQSSIGGWILSSEPAMAIAARISRFSLSTRDDGSSHWMRWFDPVFATSMWPVLSPVQKAALLGDAVWIVCAAGGRLLVLSAGDADRAEPNEGLLPDVNPLKRLDGTQSDTARHVPQVRDLMARWQALCEDQGRPPRPNAHGLLHLHVEQAHGLGLGHESVAVYSLAAMQLQAGVQADERWAALAAHSARAGIPFGDCLAELPDEFWERWCIGAPAGH
jgi:hypothetical protein